MKTTRREIIKPAALSAFGADVSKNFAQTKLEKFDREDELLSKMTLEEKVEQLTQFAGSRELFLVIQADGDI